MLIKVSDQDWVLLGQIFDRWQTEGLKRKELLDDDAGKTKMFSHLDAYLAGVSVGLDHSSQNGALSRVVGEVRRDLNDRGVEALKDLFARFPPKR